MNKQFNIFFKIASSPNFNLKDYYKNDKTLLKLHKQFEKALTHKFTMKGGTPLYTSNGLALTESEIQGFYDDFNTRYEKQAQLGNYPDGFSDDPRIRHEQFMERFRYSQSYPGAGNDINCNLYVDEIKNQIEQKATKIKLRFGNTEVTRDYFKSKIPMCLNNGLNDDLIAQYYDPNEVDAYDIAPEDSKPLPGPYIRYDGTTKTPVVATPATTTPVATSTETEKEPEFGY